jgi:hypothetical protein
MLVQVQRPIQPQASTTLNFYDGEFDASIGLPPQFTHGDYWRGYLVYTLQTGNTPF